MKTILAVLTLLILTLSVSQAQNLTYKLQNGYITMLRNGSQIKSITAVGCTVDTTQRPSTGYTSCYLNFISGGEVILRLTYSASNDSISGRTAIQAKNLLNQVINGYKSNYLGAYTKSELIAPDTATVGKTYYDTDSASLRVKRAVGGFITLTKNGE